MKVRYLILYFIYTSIYTAVSQVVILPSGTAVSCGFQGNLTESDLNIGDEIELRVIDDILVEGRIVIPKGSNVKGEISKCDFMESIIAEDIKNIAMQKRDYDSNRNDNLGYITRSPFDKRINYSTVTITFKSVRTISGMYIELIPIRRTFSSKLCTSLLLGTTTDPVEVIVKSNERIDTDKTIPIRATPTPTDVKQGYSILLKGTPIKISPVISISSTDIKKGQKIHFEVINDIINNKNLLIRKGAKATGEIIKLENTARKIHEIHIKIFSISCNDNTFIAADTVTFRGISQGIALNITVADIIPAKIDQNKVIYFDWPKSEGSGIDNVLQALPSKRIALVIGNTNYKFWPSLFNPKNDALAMTKKLDSLGFDVLYFKNLDSIGIISALKIFEDLQKNYGVCFVYFAGHGFEHKKNKYIVPVDSRSFQSGDSLQMSIGISIDDILAVCHANFKILVVDACRDVPIFRSPNSGIENGVSNLKVEISENRIQVFATVSGQTAADSHPERPSNGLYTGCWLNEMVHPCGKDVIKIFSDTNARVLKISKQSGHLQVPSIESTMPSNFCFCK